MLAGSYLKPLLYIMAYDPYMYVQMEALNFQQYDIQQ